MKFYLMRGEGAHDGVVAFNVDEPYFDQDFSEDIEDYIWCMKYNDEIAPAVSNIETSDGDNRPLTQEEITKYSALAETLYNECRDRVSAERAEEQRRDDEEYMAPYIAWTPRSKMSRDEMLTASDPYLLLSHLDSTGWEEWRQWVRDLPQTYDAPMNITTWSEPPANANDVVTNNYGKFKRNCERTKTLYDHYNP